MTGKNKYHIALRPDVHKELRLLGAEWNKPIGDVIEGILKFKKSLDRYKGNPTKETIDALFLTAMTNAGSVGYRAGERNMHSGDDEE